MQQSIQQEMLNKRLPFVIGTLIFLSFVLLFWMVLFQMPQNPEVASYIQTIRDANYGRTERTVAERGRIFDRNGQLLAANTLQYEIGISPNLLVPETRQNVAVQLATILGLPERDIYEKVTSDNPWELIARPISADMGQQISQLDIYGVTIGAIPHRVYPQGTLGSHIIGFVAGDGEDARGYNGVEGYYQNQLAGRVRDLEVSNLPFDVPEDLPESDRGKDIILTLDRDIQYWAESELQRAITETGATGGTIIIMNPRNGDILAMANYPAYDPNNYAEIADETVFRNQAISDEYEPGSVMKILTIAAALEKGVITPESTYNDQGRIEVGGVTIENWDREAHGVVDMTQILVQSLNVGAATVSTSMGKDNFYSMMSAFGIGRSTGVDLEGEVGGTLKVPGSPDWSESDLGTNSFGQGVAVTPLQMLTATSAIANGGLMMQPRITLSIIDGDNRIDTSPTALGRPISAETASAVTEMMVATVRDGVDKAQVPGYTIAGKTGTAQIPSPVGYEPNESIVTFVGFLPADDPQVSILIKLDRPTEYWGSLVAAPVFSRLAERLVILMEIPTDDIRHALAAEGGSVSNIQR
jgi:cell division protein FtsI/penicillin-binding protein 2